MTVWSALTREQRVIMREAVDGVTFVDILNATAADVDAPYWNRKWKQVAATAAATETLLTLGYLEVYDLRESPEATIPMSVETARRAVMDPASWWDYIEDNVDPDDLASGEDALAQEHAHRGDALHPYFVYATERGFAMVRSRGEGVGLYDEP